MHHHCWQWALGWKIAAVYLFDSLTTVLFQQKGKYCWVSDLSHVCFLWFTEYYLFQVILTMVRISSTLNLASQEHILGFWGFKPLFYFQKQWNGTKLPVHLRSLERAKGKLVNRGTKAPGITQDWPFMMLTHNKERRKCWSSSCDASGFYSSVTSADVFT